MYASHDALAEALRQRLQRVQAAYVQGGRDRLGVDLLDPGDRDAPPVAWPVRRVHPKTGRTSLHFNPYHVLRFSGMAEAEGNALFGGLRERMNQRDAEYHHRWHKHDDVIWDKCCSNHEAAGGYPVDQPRIHWRATILEWGRPRRAWGVLPGRVPGALRHSRSSASAASCCGS